MEKLNGIIERITFHNLDNGYCVLRIQARGQRDLVTVVGHLSQAIAGEFIEAEGDWVIDRSHGPQFKATALRTTPPHTTAGIAKYLGSGLVKGIGPKYAKKIVEVFGERTLDVIEKSPAYLKEVKGIGAKRIELIRESWKQNQAVHKIMTFLQSFGIGTARAVRIYKTYGETAIEQVRANPYRLSTDIWGVGFRTADELAMNLGIAPDSDIRAQAAIRHVLSEASSDGHMALPESVLIEQTSALAQIAAEILTKAIEDLRLSDEIIRDTLAAAAGVTTTAGLDAPPFLDQEPLLYLKPLFMAETGVARSLKSLLQGEHPLPEVDTTKAVSWIEKKMGIEFAPAQREAVEQATTAKVLVLTGGPGTGKTTIVRAILDIFLAKQLKVGLGAPTGRAAKRLAESTGQEAKTIHRLLEFDPGIGTFRRTKENPLDLDLLIIDEMSMADVILTNQLLRAVPPWACLILVGDIDQLPSVGAGRVLADLIECQRIPVVRLREVHRQASSSYIIQAAHAVNRGDEPDSAPAGQGDFYFIEADEPAIVIDRILTMVRDRIPARFQLDSVRDVQVLSPMHKSELGVANLNLRLQEMLNPAERGRAEVQRFGQTFRIGDKVLQTRNNYQREVFNGDIGRIAELDSVDQIVQIEFEGRLVEYDFNDLDEIQLAYAISIHKSQGSEYPAVVIPVHTQHFVMLQRNLFYTGITRGRKLVALVGSRRAMQMAVRKLDQSQRFSLLRWRLLYRDL